MPKKELNSRSTVGDVYEAVKNSTGTVEEITRIISKYQEWTDAEKEMSDQLRHHLEYLRDTGTILSDLSKNGLEEIIRKARVIEDIQLGIGRSAGSVENLAKALSDRIGELLYDARGLEGTVESWKKNLRKSEDLTINIESIMMRGEAVSNRQLASESRKAVQLQLYNRSLLTSANLHKQSYDYACKVIQKNEDGLKVSERVLKNAQSIANAYIIQENVAKRLVNLTKQHSLEEKSARKLDRKAGVDSARLVSKLAGKLGLSGVSDSLQDRVEELQTSIRLEQEKAFDKLLKEKNIRIDEAGVFHGKDKNGNIVTYEGEALEKLMAEARASVPVLDIAKNLWKGISGEILAGVFSLGTLLKLWSSFKEVNQEAVVLKQNIGSWGYSAAAANQSLATSVDWLKTAANLAEQLKMNPLSVFSTDEIGRISEAKTLLGLSDQQAASLGTRAKLIAGSIKDYKAGLVEGVNNGNRLLGTTVSHGAALKEALSASTAISVSMGNNAVRMGQAAQAALAMGMSLRDVEAISQNLLNFESSISAEMTAQLMTGRQLNLSKAREYALNNNLEGVAKEMQNTGMSMVEYGNLNVIQQESYAKALGMSREQMAQMLVLQHIKNGLSAEEVKRATKMTDEQLEAMTTATRWKMAVDKLMQSFAPVLDIVANIADAMSGIVSAVAKVTGYVTGLITKFNETAGGKVFKFIGTGVVHFATLALAIKGLGKGIAKTVTLARSIPKLFQKGGGLLGTLTGNIKSKVQEVVSQKGTGKNLPKLAQNIKKFFKILSSAQGAAAGFTATMGAAVGGILAISAAVAAVAALFWGMGQFFKGMGAMLSEITMEKVKCLPMLGLGLVSIGAGLMAVARAGILAPLVLGLVIPVLRKMVSEAVRLSEAFKSIPTKISFPKVENFSSENVESLTLLVSSLDKLSKLKIDRIERVSTAIRNLGGSIAKLSTSLLQLNGLSESEIDASTSINKSVKVGEQVAVASRYVEQAYSGVHRNEVRNTENTLNTTVQEIRKIEENIYRAVRNIDRRMDSGVKMTWDTLEFSRKLAGTPEIA